MSRKIDYLWLLVLVALLFGHLARAEEFLVQKTGGKFLGWRVNKNEFQSCQRDKLKIEDGKVSPTTEKCETKTPPPYILAGGTVQKVDRANHKVEIVTLGEHLSISTKDAATKETASVLKPGDQVEIKYSTGKQPTAVFIEKKNCSGCQS